MHYYINYKQLTSPGLWIGSQLIITVEYIEALTQTKASEGETLGDLRSGNS